MAARLRRAIRGGSGTATARCQGTRGSPGPGPVPGPHRVAQGARDGLAGRPAGRLVIGVDVTVPGGQAGAEPGRQRAQPRGQFRFVPGDPGVRQPEPDHLGRLRAEQAQRGGRLGGSARREPARVGAARMGGLPVGHRDQPQPGPGRGQQAQGAARAEHLVVGVGGHHHDAAPPGRVRGRQRGQPGPGPPVRLGRARRLDRVGRGPAGRPHGGRRHHAVPRSAASEPSWARSRSACCWRR